MNAIEQAAEDLREAVRTVEDVRVYPDVGPVVDPPAVVVGVPALEWQGVCSGPTSAQFGVYVIVPADDHAARRLFELVPRVAAVLDELPDAVVVRADPSNYPTSAKDLPAYLIQVDVALPPGG